MNRDLEAILISVQQAFDLEEVVLLEGVECVFDVVPHFGFDLATTIGKSQREIGLAGFLWLYLLAGDDETGNDDFVFEARTIREEEFFHTV